MPPHNEIFKELSYVFIAAIAGDTLAWKLRQPLILGYVVAGIAISPFTPGPSIHDPKTSRSSPKSVSSSSCSRSVWSFRWRNWPA